ncbi:MAG: hypothetical protein CMK99_17995 [Pseudomonas sp.]|nr:hypothetical protein [Pseudomonas sp.]HBS80787.1 hypothetical protein [Pseudomonas sp.]HCC62931.1 hypothetical protein [Pseudomonas sp.]
MLNFLAGQYVLVCWLSGWHALERTAASQRQQRPCGKADAINAFDHGQSISLDIYTDASIAYSA